MTALIAYGLAALLALACAAHLAANLLTLAGRRQVHAQAAR